MRKSIIVIGGGVAGLACAARLLEIEPACEVTVIEAEEQLGGLASLWRCNNFAADLGPHRLYTELPEIAELLPQLISQEQMLEVPRRSQLLLDGHFYAYPVSASEILRVMGPLKLALYGTSAMLGQMRAIAVKPRSYADAMQQAFGKALYRKIIEPYTRKVWKTAPEELSEEVARVRVSAGNTQRLVKRLLRRAENTARPTALDRFKYIRGGVEGLVQALAAKVLERGGALETGLAATRFEVSGNRISSVCAEATSEEASDGFFEASAVVSTIPITKLTCSLGAVADSLREHVERLNYVGMILVGVALGKDRMSPNTWFYFPEEHIVFNRAYEPKNFDPEMGPRGQTLVVFEVTARLDSALWQKPDHELAQLVVHDALDCGLFSREEILETYTRRLPYAYPIYTRDFRTHLDAVCRGLAKVENLVTTGRQGLFNHNNMDHSMLMGMRAAECVAEKFPAPAPKWYEGLGQFAHFRIVD
ncbi:MAG: FAD-dependent oxidoreductase [Candidatus Sumerlaeaceae bacterium]|nr:FAD-dependent oxidoreductase [Candidatus Sumerlaeaceae bacterium]